MAQHLPWALLYLGGGWGFVFWGVWRVSVSVFGHWVVGYLAHNTGPGRWQVHGAACRVQRPLRLVTMGECWHNNHHAFPGSARLGLHPGEWDPGWAVIQPPAANLGLVSRVGLPRPDTARETTSRIRLPAAS